MVGREVFGYGCLGMNREVIAFVVLLVVGVFIIVLIGVLVVDVAYKTLKVQFSNIVTINKKRAEGDSILGEDTKSLCCLWSCCAFHSSPRIGGI